MIVSTTQIAVDVPPLPEGIEEGGVDRLAPTGLHAQGGRREDRAPRLRGRPAGEVEPADHAVPVAELVGREAPEQAALLTPRRPLTVHPSCHLGAAVVERERSGQVAAAVRERGELVQGPQQQRVVGRDVGDDRPQVGLDRVEVLLRLDDPRHDRADLGERAAQAEALGEQRHLVADDGSLDERAVVDEGLHAGDEDPDPALVGLLAEKRQGLVGEGDGVDGQVEDARADDEGREQDGARARLLGRARVVEPVAQQVDRADRLAGDRRRARGAQGHLVAFGVVLVEPRQGPLEVEQRLLRATDGHRRLGRRSARPDRRRQVTHRRGMAGELGRGGELGTLGQRGGIRPMEAQALAREQAVGDRLAEQGVAEGVGRGPPRLEDVVLDGRGQRRLEGLVGEVDDPGEEVVADELTALEGDRAQHALRGVVELLDPRAEHAAQAAGQGLAGGGARDELLGEERVALRAPGDLGGRVGIGGGALDAGDELSDGVVGERGELDVLEPRDARPHGERLVEGVAAVEVVGAVGHDETDGRGEAAGQQEGDEVARGVVGPVDVLDDDEGGLRVAEGGEQGVDGLGDLARVGGPSRVLGAAGRRARRLGRAAGGRGSGASRARARRHRDDLRRSRRRARRRGGRRGCCRPGRRSGRPR